jgi:D-3-phosphoglycerate dehydrogenase
MPASGDHRLCVLHANIPAVLSQITTIVSESGANIENMINKSKGDNAYTLVDIKGNLNEATTEKVATIAGVVKVRLI